MGQKDFIINTTGNVGIDAYPPQAKLHVNGSIICSPRVTFGSAEYFEDGGSFIINCNGALQSTMDGVDDLGSSAKRWRTIYAADGMLNTSDARAKSNMQDMAYGLKEIMQLHPISFNWKDHPDDGAKLGLIAQEVLTIIPEVVVDYDQVRDEITGAITRKPAQQLGIYYSDLIPVLIKSIQQQQQIISDGNDRIAMLETKAEKVDDLEKDCCI
ncbi:MAG: tail fiber domain-containing protein [Saprospiraceae bacterium]|nr:tail fiber domain-containing protein [Saprospiraceae bacterium]